MQVKSFPLLSPPELLGLGLFHAFLPLFRGYSKYNPGFEGETPEDAALNYMLLMLEIGRCVNM